MLMFHARNGLHGMAMLLAVALCYSQGDPFYGNFAFPHHNSPSQAQLQPSAPQMLPLYATHTDTPNSLTSALFAPQGLQWSFHSNNNPFANVLLPPPAIAAPALMATSSSLLPHYRSVDSETHFVPLEEQQQLHGDKPAGRSKPFDVDVVTGELGGGSQNPGFFFQQSFPFFGNDFLNSFSGFGIGGGPAQEPWWKGPNVCTDKVEDEHITGGKKATNTDNEDRDDIVATDAEAAAATVSENDDIDVNPFFGPFHFSVNSCVEKRNKYVCKRIQHHNNKQKTLTITRQCCYGYGRSRNANFATTCEKLEIKDIESAAADMGAKEFVAKAKSSGLADELNRKNITLFMPTDAAFAAYQEQVASENNLIDAKSDEVMKRLYRRHVVAGEMSMYDVHNEQVLQTQAEGQTIRINAYELPRSLGSEPYRYTANCVPIEQHDKLSEQGLIHTLAGVLPPANANLMDIIRQRADLSIMRTVLEKTKLNELLEGDKPVTIFVPTDAAFDKFEAHLRRALKEGKGCASNILKNHILDLTFCSVAAVANAKTITYNLLGEPLRFDRSNSTADAEKSEDALISGDHAPVLINGLATIIDADIVGSNGVLHVIDTLLPTESALPLTTLMGEKNVTLFKRLLEAAGFDDLVDDMDNITVFAPTDKALQNSKWAALLEADSPAALKGNPELMDFLNYHIITPRTKTCELTDNMMPTLAGADANVRINLYGTHSMFSNVLDRATVNCARIVHFDDESCGSVLHQIDKPLIKPKQNLLELLETNPNYSKFLELVHSANLTTLLVNNNETYTLLVPKNEVFEEVEDLTKDQNDLENLVKAHIVNDGICCAGIIPTSWPFVRSIEALNGAHLRITRERRPKIENAGITKCDTIATNGIVQEINDIIVSPTRRQQGAQPFPFGHQAQHFSDFFK